MKKLLFVVAVLVIGLQIGNAQGPGVTFPSPSINVLSFGAQPDAQQSSPANINTSCTIGAGNLSLLNCTSGSMIGLFASSDIGKAIEIPKAGATQTSPVPTATLLATITGLSGSPAVNGKYLSVTISPAANQAVTSPVYVVWGTDNALPFQNALNSCPLPPNSTAYNPNLGPKGCVIVFPNNGASGTGDYLFGSGVTASNQTSFEILGMGNSSKWEGSQQAGVRFLTAMPITILTIGANTTSASPNYGGFHLDNISFVDVSNGDVNSIV